MEIPLLFKTIFRIPEYSLYTITYQEDMKKLNKKIENFVKREKIVGLAVGIAYKNFPIFKEGYGFQDRENKIPITTDKSLFRWASMSKMITSILALKLHSEGVLNLEDDINKWIKNYNKPKKIVKQCKIGEPFILNEGYYIPCMNGFVEFEINESQTDSFNITPSLILYNRSGICAYDNTPYQSYPSDEQMKDQSNYTQHFSHFIDHFLNKPFVSFPGEYNYSTFGFNLLGTILENSSGKSYMELVDHFLKDDNPEDNLKSLIPDKEVDKHKYPNRCKGYSKQKLTDDTDVSFKLPGGGFMSTLDDALDFCMKLDKKLTTFEKMLAWKKYDYTNNYGLGFSIIKHKNDVISIGHSGAQQKASTFLRYYPQEKLCVVVLSNDEDLKEGKLRDIIHNHLYHL